MPRRPTPAERALWQESQRQTEPLKGGRRQRLLSSGAKAAAPEAPAPGVQTVPSRLPPKLAPPLPAVPKAKPKPQELTHGRMAGVDRRRADRLRRGRLPIEASLDLHGMTQARAHASLTRFVLESVAAGRRSVLVVTGIGRMSERGVLREAVPRWLNEPELRAHVLGFDYAQLKDGGLGALYLLLRRKRER